MSKALEAAIVRAHKLAPSSPAGQVERALRAGDFSLALASVDSETRVSMLRAIWLAVPAGKRGPLLAAALSGGDALYQEVVFIARALRDVRSRGDLALNGASDETFFAGLPDPVTVYRGTTAAEVNDAPFFGVSWTTDRAKAEWFACSHGRFRRVDSPPVLLTQIVRKGDIAGAGADRGESEVFIDCAVTYRAHGTQALLIEPLSPAANAQPLGFASNNRKGKPHDQRND